MYVTSQIVSRLVPNRKSLWMALLLLLGLASLPQQSFALQGDTGIHDPSTVVQDSGRYWMFGTGDGIVSRYSDDMVTWHEGPTVFTAGTWPSWISSYVPAFAGTFWAPDLHKMNGVYYLFYSASSWGSPISAIGVAMTTSLNNPSWTDLGMVVYSNSSSTINAIDPAVFRDANSTPWLVYGSYQYGIGLVQLNQSTAKPANTTLYTIAGNSGGSSGMEGPYIVYRNGYYYLFVNKGTCCAGTSSTYYIQVGRSSSVTGPYVDQSGTAMTANGGTTLISSSGRYIGPGHFSDFYVGSTEYMGFHYYDGYDNGAPKYNVSHITWSNGWPVYSPNWVADGTYKVTNVYNGLSWDNWGCTGANLEAVAQSSYAGYDCQKWTFQHLGSGVYRINSYISGRAVEAYNCSPDNGTVLDTYDYWGGTCQQFKLERTVSGSYVLSSMNGDRVIDVTDWSTTAGTQLQLYDSLEADNQRWLITSP